MGPARFSSDASALATALSTTWRSPRHAPPSRPGTRGIHRIEFTQYHPDRDIQAYLCHLATKSCRAGPNLCARDRDGKPDAYRSEVSVSLLPPDSGMGKLSCPFSVDQRHSAQPRSHPLGRSEEHTSEL